MGEVWRCHDRARDAPVAVKLVLESVLDETTVAARLDDAEAARAALARLGAVRGDYGGAELREVLAIGRDAAPEELAAPFDAAIGG